MAGVYIHVPFCKTICHYCDFYRITDKVYYKGYIDALLIEIDSFANFFQTNEIKTVYFGGGTPSQLHIADVELIVNQLSKYFDIHTLDEFTFEMNPDDVTVENLTSLKDLGVNRISLGVQSFDSEILRYLNRRHSVDSALNAVSSIQSVGGFEISIDLIYGIPDLSVDKWVSTLKVATDLKVNHISAYHLTIEKDTIFGKMYEQGLINIVTEEVSVQQFETMMDLFSETGFEQYEISNFARKGKYAQHNSSYWLGENYIGLGPGAHSYSSNSRFWNISDVGKYIQKMKSSDFKRESEILSPLDLYHEYIITHLRTKWGIDTYFLDTRFKDFHNVYSKAIDRGVQSGNLYITNKGYALTRKGILVSDFIFKDFFVD